jgi:group I intron endonuclease
MIVYKITNLVNGKIYIGQTTVDLYKRWRDHISRASNNIQTYLYNAIRKYGKKSFRIEQISNGIENRDALDFAETFLIALYESNKSAYGYNMTSGGRGSLAPIPEVRKKIAEASKKKVRRIGLKMSEEAKAKRMESWIRNDKPYKFTNEGKKKMLEATAEWTNSKENAERLCVCRKKQLAKKSGAKLPKLGLQ